MFHWGVAGEVKQDANPTYIQLRREDNVKKKSAASKSSKASKVKVIQTTGHGGSFGAAVTSADGYGPAGEPKSVTCHGFARGK